MFASLKEKRLALLVALALFALIGVAPTAQAASCSLSASYDIFMALGAGGCTVAGDNILINNFNLVSTANPTSNAIPASSISLSFDTSVPGQLAMTWNTGMSATGAGVFQDLFFSFSLTGLNGITFNGDYLIFNGSATGGGSTGVSSIVCTSGPVNTCPVANKYQTQVFNPPPILADVVSFPDSSQIWATKDFIASGAANGTGQISSVTNTYMYSNEAGVPEPGTYALIGAGLAGIAALRRRQNS